MWMLGAQSTQPKKSKWGAVVVDEEMLKKEKKKLGAGNLDEEGMTMDSKLEYL